MARLYSFIDAAYVRESLDDLKVDWRSLDLSRLAILGCRAVWPTVAWQPHRNYFYDAARDDPGDDEDPDIREWLERNDLQPQTHLRWGKLAGSPGRKAPRQKRVDVQLAADALAGAYRGLYDAALLITGDGDFAPLVEAIRESGPTVAVAVFDVPSNSEELRRTADRWGTIPADTNLRAILLSAPASASD